jgi:hypothetical protein
VAVIVVVLVVAVFGCGIVGSLGVFGFKRYMERARAARSARATPAAPLGGSSSGGSPTTPTGDNVFRSSDGHSQITPPASYRSMPELGAEGVVRAGDGVSSEYMIVISEKKGDFAPGFDLSKYGDVVVGAMRSKLTTPEIGDASSVTINGRSALQYEVRGAVDLVNIGYLVTVIDGAKHFHQVLMWTSKAQLTSRKPSFQKTTATFREL